MTEITLLGIDLSTIDPADLHGYNPEADTGHLLVQLPDRTKKIVWFEAVYLNLGLVCSVYKSHNVQEIICIFFYVFLLYVYPEAL